MNLGALIKLARGGGGDMGELLKALGVNMTFTAVPVGADAFRSLAGAASLPSCRLVEIRGKMPSGETIHGLLVVNQESN